MAITENIKNHPIVAIAILLSAFVTGLATFTTSLNQIPKIVTCLPIKLGFDDAYQGNATLSYQIHDHDWKKIGEIRREKPTGNHHCSSNCDGEPTRTSYGISVSVNDFKKPNLGDRKLQDPNLACVSGPCHGWNEITNVSISENSNNANASFDVWSHPTKWVLTADVYEYQKVSAKSVEKDLELSSNDLLRIEVPNDALEVIVNGKMEDERSFALNPDPDNNSEILVYNAIEKNLDHSVYVYQVKDIRCQ